MIKKSLLNIGIIVFLGSLLTIGIPHQINLNLFENNFSYSLSSLFNFVYAQGNGPGSGGDVVGLQAVLHALEVMQDEGREDADGQHGQREHQGT